jgi:hypothetical protein
VYAIRIYTFTGAGLDYIYRGDMSGLPVTLATDINQISLNNFSK